MNTDLTNKAKNDFEKYFFKLMNNWDFEETMEKVNNHKGIQVYKNRSNKELFSIRIKLSNNKKFFGKFVSNKKEENTDTHV